MNTSMWVGLAVLAIGVVVCLALLMVRRQRRSDPGRQERLRAARDREAVNLARQMWRASGE